MYFAIPESGARVRFRLASVVCPDTESVLEKITEGLALEGRVLYLSDSGDEKDHYAVVEVPGIMVPVIVPIAKLNVVDQQTQAAEV